MIFLLTFSSEFTMLLHSYLSNKNDSITSKNSQSGLKISSSPAPLFIDAFFLFRLLLNDVIRDSFFFQFLYRNTHSVRNAAPSIIYLQNKNYSLIEERKGSFPYGLLQDKLLCNTSKLLFKSQTVILHGYLENYQFYLRNIIHYRLEYCVEVY